MDAQILVKELVSQLEAYQNELSEIDARRNSILSEVKELQITLERVKRAMKGNAAAKTLIDPALRQVQTTLVPRGVGLDDVLLSHLLKYGNKLKTGELVLAARRAGYDFGEVKDPYNKTWLTMKRLEKTGVVSYDPSDKAWSAVVAAS